MAWPFPSRRKQPTALVASVQEVPHERGRIMAGRSKDADWQSDGWGFYKNLGEVRFAARYMGNSLSRVRFFVGTRDHPGDPVVPIPDDTDHKDDLQYRDLLERIKGKDGTFASLVRLYGIHQFVAGEDFLVGAEGLEGEVWEFLSTTQLRALARASATGGTNEQYERLGRDGKYETITDNSVVIRFWTRDPEQSDRADSPMRAVLDIALALTTAQAMQTAGDLSRLATAGIYFVPAEAELPKTPLTDSSGSPSQQARLMLIDQLQQAMTAAMANPASYAAVAPILVETKAEYIDKFRRETFEREVDRTIVQRIDHLIRRLAQGLDLPPAVLLGTEGMNHWGAWQIAEETITAHIAPMAAAFCEDLTVGFLQPTLTALKAQDLDRYAIGFDVTDLIVSPDRAQHAVTLWDNFQLGGDHLMEALGFDPAQKPEPEEIEYRIAIIRASNPSNPDPTGDLAVIRGEKRPEPAPPPTTPPPPEEPELPPAAKTPDGGENNGKQNPRNAQRENQKTPQADKTPPDQPGTNTQTAALVQTIAQAINQASGAWSSPEYWRPLRDELARQTGDMAIADQLIESAIALTREKKISPALDVTGPLTVLCEAALWDGELV